MGLRTGYILLFAVVFTCTHVNAKNLVALDVTAMSMDHQVQSKIEDSKETATNEQICSVCQVYACRILEFLRNNETQATIYHTLHQICDFLQPIKLKCRLFVDKYATLFFVNVALVHPALLCKAVRLCGDIVSIHVQNSDDACMLCHNVVKEVLTKLHEPDKQLEIIKTLLGVCKKTGSHEQECKKLVFGYGPVILANAVKVFHTMDICAATQVCKAATLKQALLSSAGAVAI